MASTQSSNGVASPSAAVPLVGIVCDEGRLQRAHETALRVRVRVEWLGASADSALARLPKVSPALVVVEWPERGMRLDAGLEQLTRLPMRPALAVVGRPNRAELFLLAQMGIDAYFESFESLVLSPNWSLSQTAVTQAIRVAARTSLGRCGVVEAQKALRREMFSGALREARGNRHAAARVLKVDRRYVLKMLQEHPELSSAGEVEQDD